MSCGRLYRKQIFFHLDGHPLPCACCCIRCTLFVALCMGIIFRGTIVCLACKTWHFCELATAAAGSSSITRAAPLQPGLIIFDIDTVTYNFEMMLKLNNRIQPAQQPACSNTRHHLCCQHSQAKPAVKLWSSKLHCCELISGYGIYIQ